MKESLDTPLVLGGGGGEGEGTRREVRERSEEVVDRGGSSWRGALWRGEGEGKRQGEGRWEDGGQGGRAGGYGGVWGSDWERSGEVGVTEGGLVGEGQCDKETERKRERAMARPRDRVG